MKSYRTRADVESAIDQEIDKQLNIINKSWHCNYSKQEILGDSYYKEEKTNFQFLNEEEFEIAMVRLSDAIYVDIDNEIFYKAIDKIVEEEEKAYREAKLKEAK